MPGSEGRDGQASAQQTVRVLTIMLASESRQRPRFGAASLLWKLKLMGRIACAKHAHHLLRIKYIKREKAESCAVE